MPDQNGRVMLDTNIASYIIKGANDVLRQRLINTSPKLVCISSITQAELLRGVALKPKAKNLTKIVDRFLQQVDILPWDSLAAVAWAGLRTATEKAGKSLSAMDMLIAAHAVSLDATLISNDKAFRNVEKFLETTDWTK